MFPIKILKHATQRYGPFTQANKRIEFRLPDGLAIKLPDALLQLRTQAVAKNLKIVNLPVPYTPVNYGYAFNDGIANVRPENMLLQSMILRQDGYPENSGIIDQSPELGILEQNIRLYGDDYTTRQCHSVLGEYTNDDRLDTHEATTWKTGDIVTYHVPLRYISNFCANKQVYLSSSTELTFDMRDKDITYVPDTYYYRVYTGLACNDEQTANDGTLDALALSNADAPFDTQANARIAVPAGSVALFSYSIADVPYKLSTILGAMTTNAGVTSFNFTAVQFATAAAAQDLESITADVIEDQVGGVVCDTITLKAGGTQRDADRIPNNANGKVKLSLAGTYADLAGITKFVRIGDTISINYSARVVANANVAYQPPIKATVLNIVRNAGAGNSYITIAENPIFSPLQTTCIGVWLENLSMPVTNAVFSITEANLILPHAVKMPKQIAPAMFYMPVIKRYNMPSTTMFNIETTLNPRTFLIMCLTPLIKSATDSFGINSVADGLTEYKLRLNGIEKYNKGIQPASSEYYALLEKNMAELIDIKRLRVEGGTDKQINIITERIMPGSPTQLSVDFVSSAGMKAKTVYLIEFLAYSY